ncbi:metallophosphoesterase family protein [Lactiplantibacillus plantarum]|uniref:metallophosphoesterase family protein n=1 Tax=Lactiplantibacillus plantarum TaxID=1590 RepID=UPI00223F54C5|nr:metallophosphoesterase [Lactiplantibacillus plantarum]
MISAITLDTYKQQIGSGDAFNLSDSFNGRVGDEQVPLVIQFKERGLAQQFQDGLVPFMTGFVGSLDENSQVTADTGEAVSYVGTSDDIVGLGRVKMNLPGTMFPHEGFFYGFLGLRNAGGKRVTTFNVWFHVYGGNPDMFVNQAPFRSELQKVLDQAQSLIDATDGELKTKIQAFDDKIVATFDKWNGDYATIQQTVTDLTSKLADIAQKVKDGNVVTAKDLDDKLLSFENRFAELTANVHTALGDFQDGNDLNGYFKDEVDEVGGPIPAYACERLDQFTRIPTSNLNIGFITDNHHQLSSYSPHSINHYVYMAAASRRARLDAVVAGGDNTNGWYSKQEKLVETRQATSVLANRVAAGTDVYYVFGNHDNGVGQNGNNTPDTCLSDAEIKAYYRTADKVYGETRDGDSLYGYKDYNDKKVRLIWLNSFDLPYTLNSDGTYEYDFLTQSGYQNQQLNWLANQALKVPDNSWQVMIFTHCPLPGTFEVAAGQPQLSQYNSDVLIGIINAFQSGTKYSQADAGRTFPINVTCDYTSQGKAIVIGLFNGHIHRDGQMTYDGINCIETAASLCSSLNPGRIKDTIAEDCWDIFSVDTANRKIHAYRFGYGADRDFTY